MISKWDDFKRINEDINYHAMKMCGYYRMDENRMNFILNDLAFNKIMCKYDPGRNYTEIETTDFDKPYEIILKNGGEKLPFNLEDSDYDHDCIVLRSKPMNVPDGAYM